MIGQPSSPGMWVCELRLGGVKLIAGEATLCIDMTVAPSGTIGSHSRHPERPLAASAQSMPSEQDAGQKGDKTGHAFVFCFSASFCRSGALIVGIATRPGPVCDSAAAAFSFSMIFAITAWP